MAPNRARAPKLLPMQVRKLVKGRKPRSLPGGSPRGDRVRYKQAIGDMRSGKPIPGLVKKGVTPQMRARRVKAAVQKEAARVQKEETARRERQRLIDVADHDREVEALEREFARGPHDGHNEVITRIQQATGSWGPDDAASPHLQMLGDALTRAMGYDRRASTLGTDRRPMINRAPLSARVREMIEETNLAVRNRKIDLQGERTSQMRDLDRSNRWRF